MRRLSCLARTRKRRHQRILLRPHQESVVKHLVRVGSVLAMHGTGSGKTLTACAAVACLMQNRVVRRAILVVQKSTATYLESEVRRFWPEAPTEKGLLEFVTIEKLKIRAKQGALHSKDVFVVVDESHKTINTLKPGRDPVSLALFNFFRGSKRLLLMTATPIVNCVYDLATPMALLRREEVKPENEFEKIYANEERFRQYFANYISVYLIDKNVSPDYPNVEIHNVRVPMTPDTAKAYNACTNELQSFFHLERALTFGLGMCEKCEWLEHKIREWVLAGQGKIAIYCERLETGCMRVKKMIDGMVVDGKSVGCAVIDGGATKTFRSEAVAAFNQPLGTAEKKRQRALQQTRKRRHREEQLLLSADIEMQQHKATSSTRCGKTPLVIRTSVLSAADAAGDDASAGKSKKRWVHSFEPRLSSLAPAQRDAVLRVPEGYPRVEMCPDNARGLLYVAEDSRGRMQYRYDRDHAERHEWEKVKRLAHLSSAFWARFDDFVMHRVHTPTGSDFVSAVATRIMRHCHFRPGCLEPDEESNREGEKHFGLITLEVQHVTCRSKSVVFRFTGKSNKENICEIADDLPLRDAIAHLLDVRVGQGERRLFGTRLRRGSLSAASLRAFLCEASHHATGATERFVVRPKDFRTYHANVELLKWIRVHGGPHPAHMSVRDRGKLLSNAFQSIARDLNNLPSTVKSAYVFTGFWTLFMIAPEKFHAGEIFAADDDDNARIGKLIHAFKNGTLPRWQDLLESHTRYRSKLSVLGDLNVLLFTDAGCEGMDLKGTCHVVLMNIPFTEAKHEQIIGRGQRFLSHPPNSIVRVWRTFLIRPLAGARGSRTVETRIYEDIILPKRELRRSFESRIGPISIPLASLKRVRARKRSSAPKRTRTFRFGPWRGGTSPRVARRRHSKIQGEWK